MVPPPIIDSSEKNHQKIISIPQTQQNVNRQPCADHTPKEAVYEDSMISTGIGRRIHHRNHCCSFTIKDL